MKHEPAYEELHAGHNAEIQDSTIILLRGAAYKNKVGGKAANLSALIAGGFSVPGGVVVTVDAYRQFISQNGLNEAIDVALDACDLNDERCLATCSDRIKTMVLTPRMDDAWCKRVCDALTSIDDGALWAVRSSAEAEDTEEASFAGQQDTYLNIAREDVPEYVKRCWASYWNDRAIAYRHAAGVSQAEGGIAVVVQKMANSRVSGVMFTLDPVGGDENHIVIESSWGLGESIVSGIVTPDRFVCDKQSLKLINKKVNRKTKGIFLSKGAVASDIESSRQQQPSLTDAEVKAIARIGRDVERYFGAPQDIEWAIEGNKVCLLQSRPITTRSKTGATLWTRGYGDEYWADVTSPLFFSLLGRYLSDYVLGEGDRIMGYSELEGKELLKVHKGHIYFNTEVLEIVFTFNPKFSRTKELLNYFPESDQSRIANEPTKIARRILAEIRIAALDPDGMITRTDKAYRRWAKSFLQQMKAFDAVDLTRLNDQELHEKFLELERSYLKHYRLIRYGMVTHSIGSNLILKTWLQEWLDDRSGALYAKMISGLGDNKTIKTNIAIAKLADAVRNDDHALGLLKNGNVEGFIEGLKDNPSLNTALESFMREYGHRSHTREIYFPRWADDPSLIVDVLRSLVASPRVDMDAMASRAAEERIATEKAVLARISKLKYGIIKKQAFKAVMRVAQTYLMFRENQRFYLDHQIYRLRRLFMEYGRRYKERGLIEAQEDIFFLSKEEIFGMPENGSEVLKEIPVRKKEFKEYEDRLPPKFLRGDREFDDTVAIRENTLKVAGTSSSPGIATGFVRVVESIKDLPKIGDGEILVTSNTDPGWTPVFYKIGGLITETGGILSHGAVVSREYGIPAVTAVKNARSIFKTGQHIRIDGNEGFVYILEE